MIALYEDTIQGDRATRVVGGGDAAEGKFNNHIEATTAVVRTVGAAMDGRELRGKGDPPARRFVLLRRNEDEVAMTSFTILV